MLSTSTPTVRRRNVRRSAPAAEIVSDMAEVLRERRRETDSAGSDDLKRSGFSEAEIAEHGDAAVTEARRLDRAAAA